MAPKQTRRSSANPSGNQPPHVSEYGGTWLRIESLDELFRHEAAIVERINATLNGGYLFMTNPLLLFENIGIVLSAKARGELLRLEPRLGSHSDAAYRALANSRDSQGIHFHLRGLFERKTLP
jgi:hypothetical protein